MDSQSGKGWTNVVQASYRMNQNQKFSQLNTVQKFRYGFERVKQIAKGTSKDEKAKTIMKKHWLEATDPKHRYGNALIVYFNYWLQQENTDDESSFWLWLDTPDSRGDLIDLEEFPREKMERYTVKYCDAEERKQYVVEIKDGKFYNKESQKLINTDDAVSDEDEKGKYIFVISTDKTIYAGPKVRGKFHHSSFLSGASILGAGNLEIDNGILRNIKPHSGHYMPTTTEFIRLITIIQEKGVNMDEVALGTIKVPKNKNKEKLHPNLNTQSFETFKRILTKNFKNKQESEAAVSNLIESLGSRLSLDEYFERRSHQNSPKSNGNYNNNGFQQDQINQDMGDFDIPQSFLQQDSIPVFFKRGYNESGDIYKQRVEQFLMLLSRQELVFIISKVDPSRKEMQPFSLLLQQVMKQQLSQQTNSHQNSQYSQSICQ